MSNLLPWIFMVLAAVMLFVALLAFWQSLRAALGVASVDEARGIIESEERAALNDEKASLLRSIRDLELDRDSDKISEEDFERLNRRLRARARDVLKMLDHDVRAYRPAAEELVAKRLSEVGVTPYRSSGGAAPEEPPSATEPGEAGGWSEPGAPETEVEAHVCAECATQNDPDAVFCKKCGTRLAGEEGGER